MTDCDFEEFAANFLPSKKPKSTVVSGEDLGEDFDAFKALFEKPAPLGCANPEDIVAKILAHVPDADSVYIHDLARESSEEFILALFGPMSKRAKFVRDSLLRQRFVTTEQIKLSYDPMAIRDLEEHGIPLRRITIRGSSGRATTQYELDSATFKRFQESRTALTTKAREQLLETHGAVCKLCPGSFDRRVLEADHRIPFVLVGNLLAKTEGLSAFQPLCPSCNTKKDSVCTECPNKEPDICRTCYWAYPEKYTHIATKKERRLVLVASTPEQMASLSILETEARLRGL